MVSEFMKQLGDFPLAGSEAQMAIQARLRDFQKGRHKHMHRARVIVPARVAALLAGESQLIAPAVETFHYRDVDDMRAARRMQHFPAQASASNGSSSEPEHQVLFVWHMHCFVDSLTMIAM